MPNQQSALHMLFKVKRLAEEGSRGLHDGGWSHTASLRTHHFGLDSKLTRTTDHTLPTIKLAMHCRAMAGTGGEECWL